MELREEIIDTYDELYQQLNRLDQCQLNTVPFEGSWTAAQVADHILKFTGDVNRFLHARVSDTMRPFDQHVKALRTAFLDFSTKMKSPEFILPSTEPFDKKELLRSISNTKFKLLDALRIPDLTRTCGGFEMPGMGFLTRFEWLHFWSVHTQRHVHQLKQIASSISQVERSETPAATP